MNLSSSLVSRFAKAIKTKEKKAETTLYGTIVEDGGSLYVKLDGSEYLTPVSTTVDSLPGERVTVLIKNHEAIVTGNISSPAARSGTVKDIDNRTTTSRLVDMLYPIGSIYMNVSETSPETLFGGKWEQIKDTFLLASGTAYVGGTTGGEASHTLTLDEMPSHEHTGKGWAAVTDGSGSYYVLGAAGNSSRTYSTNTTGGSQPHNNMPPYLAVYVWKRIE